MNPFPPRATQVSRADRIIARVRAIPEGFVQTYGDIDPGAPRLVGRVLAQHPPKAAGTGGTDIPWHRVVRADGTVAKGTMQLERLRWEGVPVRDGRVDLRRARLPAATLFEGRSEPALWAATCRPQRKRPKA